LSARAARFCSKPSTLRGKFLKNLHFCQHPAQ
jgi:hypothetical protein